MNTIERVDKIDEYLAMSDADKKEFERSNSVSEVSSDNETIRHEDIEQQKEIIFAIRRRSFREQMQKEIRAINKQEPRSHVIRTIASIVVAACLVGVFIIPVGWPSSVEGNKYTNENISLYKSYASLKGAGDAEEYIADAYVALSNNEYRKAAKLSREAIRLLQDTNDPFKVDMRQDAEWYNALANLSRRQLWYTIKAKNDVERIASQEMHKHYNDANKLLKSLKGKNK